MLTTGQAGRQLGIGDHVIARLARKGLVELQRCGRNYVISESELPDIRRALEGRDVVRYDRGEDDDAGR
jgi:hypothetical protein